MAQTIKMLLATVVFCAITGMASANENEYIECVLENISERGSEIEAFISSLNNTQHGKDVAERCASLNERITRCEAKKINWPATITKPWEERMKDAFYVDFLMSLGREFCKSPQQLEEIKNCFTDELQAAVKSCVTGGPNPNLSCIQERYRSLEQCPDSADKFFVSIVQSFLSRNPYWAPSAQVSPRSEPSSAQVSSGSDPTSALPSSGSESTSAQVSSGSESTSAQVSSGSESTSVQVSSGSESTSALPSSGSESTNAQVTSGSESTSAQVSSGSETTSAQVSSGSESTSAQVPASSEPTDQCAYVDCVLEGNQGRNSEVEMYLGHFLTQNADDVAERCSAFIDRSARCEAKKINCPTTVTKPWEERMKDPVYVEFLMALGKDFCKDPQQLKDLRNCVTSELHTAIQGCSSEGPSFNSTCVQDQYSKLEKCESSSDEFFAAIFRWFLSKNPYRSEKPQIPTETEPESKMMMM